MQTLLLRRLLAFLALLLVAPIASAALVTYTVEGSFTGAATDDTTLRNAISPLLAGQSLTLTVSLDTSVSGSATAGGVTLYRAVTGSSTHFAGFASASGTCPSVSDFICTASVHDGSGGFADPDRFDLFPSIERSAALEAAAGLGRRLDLQFMLFITDFSGLLLDDSRLAVELSSVNVALVQGQLGVFASNGSGFDRASFDFSVSRIGTDAPRPMPEPGSLALALLALSMLRGLAGARSRRTALR